MEGVPHPIMFSDDDPVLVQAAIRLSERHPGPELLAPLVGRLRRQAAGLVDELGVLLGLGALEGEPRADRPADGRDRPDRARRRVRAA